MRCPDCPFAQVAEQLNAQAAADSIRSFDAGQVIFKQGDHGCGLYCVEEGNVVLLAEPNEERNIPIGFASKGSLLGVAATNIGMHNHTAEALTPVRTCFISADLFKQIEPTLKPSFRQRLMRQLMSELKLAEGTISHAWPAKLQDRLEHLYYLAQEGLGQESKYRAIDTLPATRLAQWLGVTPEAVKRVVK